MPDRARQFLLLACLSLTACEPLQLVPDATIDCDDCERWNQPQEPFRIYGNTYYVGTAGLSAVLVATGEGLILFDAGLPQSAAPIATNIRALGFDPRDIKVIAVSHAHFDHIGGVAALQRLSDAAAISSASAVPVLRDGAIDKDDPQYNPDNPTTSFPPLLTASAIDDSGRFMVGDLAVRGIVTPGHTPGGMTWTWQSCEADQCLDVVYADSLSPVAAPGYRFGDGMGEEIRRSAARIAALGCDIFLSTHDFSFELHEKLALGRDAFIDPGGCKRYAEKAVQQVERRLEQESAES